MSSESGLVMEKKPETTDAPYADPGTSATSLNSDASIKPNPAIKQPPEFVEDTASLLAKYADQPPSIELHIYASHYRFKNQEGIIPKPNPVMNLFLESVKQGEIPAIAGEVFRDSGIPLYEGCAILNLVDYRNFNQPTRRPSQDFEKSRSDSAWETRSSAPKVMDTESTDNKSEAPKVPPSAEKPAGSSGPTEKEIKPETSMEKSSEKSEDSEPKLEHQIEENKPPSFRVLLRPTGCGLLNDLMSLSDAGTGRRLTDMFTISLESEILNITVRNLDLRVPDRRQFDIGLREPTSLSFAGRPNGYMQHRLTHPRKLRKITDCNPHKSTEYEDFMLGMANTEKASRGSSQFVRMSFVESLRRKKNINQAGLLTTRKVTTNKPAGRPASRAGTPTDPAGPTNMAGGFNGGGANMPPTKINQPDPSTLSRQLLQSQQIAQQSAKLLQQQPPPQQLSQARPTAPIDSQNSFGGLHVPPGPTAQHQIQAQQQQQAILRARAERQQQIQAQQQLPQQKMQQVQQQRMAGNPNMINQQAMLQQRTQRMQQQQQAFSQQQQQQQFMQQHQVGMSGNQSNGMGQRNGMPINMHRPSSAMGNSGPQVPRPASQMSYNGSMRMNQGAVNNGSMAQGNMTHGNMNQGNMNQGNMNQGNMNQGNMNQGNMNQGNMSQGNMNQGNMNQGNMSQSNMSQNGMMSSPMARNMSIGGSGISPQMTSQMMADGAPGSHMNNSMMSRMSPQAGHQMMNRMSPNAGPQSSPQINPAIPNQMKSMGRNMNSQMGNNMMNNQMGNSTNNPGQMSGMNMNSSMMRMNGVGAANGSQAANRSSSAMPAGNVGQQVPTQIPSQMQQMQAGQGRGQYTPQQLRQILAHRARMEQQQRQRQQQQEQQQQQQDIQMPPGFSQDFM